jgi:chromate transporter
LRSDRVLSAALATITAAVVGVILNLAVWFTLHVVFREVGRVDAGPLDMVWPVFGSLDPAATVLAASALVTAFRFGVGPAALLAAAAAAGLLLRIATGAG